MYTVKFDKAGSGLWLDIQYHGSVVASYVYALWEANSNAIVNKFNGNNKNIEDDSYDLPTPVLQNTNRLIHVLSTLSNVEISDLKARVIIKVYQGDAKISEIIDDEDIKGKKTILNQIFIKLIPS